MKLFYSVLLIFLQSCDANDADSSKNPSDSLGSKVFMGQLVNDNKEIGWALQDDLGFSLIGISRSPGGIDFSEVFVALADGTSVALKLDAQGRPEEARMQSGTVFTFSNYTSTTYDILISDGKGLNESLMGLDFSEFAKEPDLGLIDENTSRGNWDKFTGALTISLRLAACPVSVAKTGGTLGLTLAWAVTSCTLAAKIFKQVLTGETKINVTDQLPKFVVTAVCDPTKLRDREADNLTPCLQALFENKELAHEVAVTIEDIETVVYGESLIFQGTLQMTGMTVDGKPFAIAEGPPQEFSTVITKRDEGYRIHQDQIKALEQISGKTSLQHVSTEHQNDSELSGQVVVSYEIGSENAIMRFSQGFTLSEDLQSISGIIEQTTTSSYQDSEGKTVTSTTVISFAFDGKRTE